MRKEKASGSNLVKIPVQLAKRMSDGPTGEQRWQIEVPEQFAMKGAGLEAHKQKFFVLIGPFEEEAEIEKAIK